MRWNENRDSSDGESCGLKRSCHSPTLTKFRRVFKVSHRTENMRATVNTRRAMDNMHDMELKSRPKFPVKKNQNPSTSVSGQSSPGETRQDSSTPRPVRKTNDTSIKSESLVKKGVEMHQKAQYEKALWCFQEAIKSQVLEYGSDHPVVGQTLSNIGSVYLRQGRLLLAEDALKAALEIMEQARARCQTEEERQAICISDVLNNLGNLAYLEGSYTKSMQFYRQNLGELRRWDIIDEDLADTLHNIGRLHVIRREWDAASGILAQCQQTEERIYGSGSPQVADTLELIGYVCLSQEYHDNALVMFSEALTIHQRHFGPINENVATGLTNVAMVLGAQGNFDAAFQTYQAAKDVFQSIPGVAENHGAYKVACRGVDNLRARMQASPTTTTTPSECSEVAASSSVLSEYGGGREGRDEYGGSREGREEYGGGREGREEYGGGREGREEYTRDRRGSSHLFERRDF